MTLKGESISLIRAILICAGAIVFQSSPVVGQGDAKVVFRSRAEYIAARRNLEQTFPELLSALRTLRLPPDKMHEVEARLRVSENSIRAARQELRALEEDNEKQGYSRESKSARAEELRASLKQSTDQLESEIKNLLTPQQREQFDRHLQKQNRRSSRKEKNR